MHYTYKKAIVGGTFDRFHAGHRALLETAFAQSAQVTIGLSIEKLYSNKLLASVIESYEKRLHTIQSYLVEKQLDKRAEIVPIEDIFGTSLQDAAIEAIFVTEENVQAAKEINRKRLEHSLSSISIQTVPFVLGNDNEVITSERIRKGEIDRSGFSYKKVLANKSLTLPKALRTELRNPIGIVVQDFQEVEVLLSNAPMIIAVGDIVTLTLIQSGKQAHISLFDYKTRRHALNKQEEDLLHSITPSFVCTNHSGRIEKEAVEFLYHAIAVLFETGNKQTIKINGEEDLLALPAILFAPLGSVVLYGLFDQGAVVVEVTEQKKKEIAALLHKFET